MFLELKWKGICISQIKSSSAALQTILDLLERVRGEKDWGTKTHQRGGCGWCYALFAGLGRLRDWYIFRYLEFWRVSALLNHFLHDQNQRWRSKIWWCHSSCQSFWWDIQLSRVLLCAVSAGHLHLHPQLEIKPTRCYFRSPNDCHSQSSWKTSSTNPQITWDHNIGHSTRRREKRRSAKKGWPP